ncbi:hypothetical protein [Nocardia sp. NBC_01329]|uniref:hypothetical protein n=1 Tax=Nocardia sp. NBC_01329 TaxID=2903594 RepID=UPI002E1222F1|nr:hypothetical protein OG405_05505 [Nocardia sp. NBC_01329]
MVDNEFGYTRWGMDWVRLAEPLRQTRPEPLLPRARSIARNSGVHTVTEGRIVRAHIHRGGKASITHIELAPPARTTVTALTAIVGTAPTLLTDEMHAAARAADIPVAPELAAIDCSCSARTARCVHVLATFYDLARRVDEDPRLSLDLQGFGQPDHGAAAGDSGAVAERPRWIPLNALDPAGFFEV